MPDTDANRNGPSSSSRKQESGGGAMTAQQQRLQQMIALQHAHSDSMRKDYITRTSSVGSSSRSPPASPKHGTFAATEKDATEQQRHRNTNTRNKVSPELPAPPVNPHTYISPMDPSMLTSLSMATPTLSNVSVAAAAASANNMPRITSAGGGRTAEYAKLLPGGGNESNKGGQSQGSGGKASVAAGNNRNNNGGNIHYQDYSQCRQQQGVPVPAGQTLVPIQQQNRSQMQQPDLMSHDNDSVQFHDAASHVSHQTYGSTATSTRIGGGGGSSGGYHQPTMGANFNISSQPSHHNFHYGDPSHAFGHGYSHGYEYPYHHGHDPFDNQCICCRCCRSCGPNVLQADNLHRSLCFGAIDGMLTGSGITAACAGLGILTTSSASSALWAVVALSLAACASDGVCMCLGHIWSTYVLQRASIAEKTEEEQNFNRDRATSKARLVDMLLDRGMLKIDAMSVADTLEGYPDIFVSALVGDAGALGPGSGGSLGGSAENLRKVASHGSAGALGVAHSEHAPHQGGQPGLGRRSSLHYGSYGQFGERRDDPAKSALNEAMKDGWNEGLVMMLSFSSFSVIPSLCFLLASRWFPYDPQESYYSSSGDPSLITVAISMLSVVMLLLGMWKSRFYDSHWILFGIEAVLVLLASLATAYSIGACLKHHFSLELFGSVSSV